MKRKILLETCQIFQTGKANHDFFGAFLENLPQHDSGKTPFCNAVTGIIPLDVSMKISETLGTARYMVDPQGNRTDVVIPLETWQKLLAVWERLVDRLEYQEDRAFLGEWLARRAAGEKDTVSLAALEKELIADGLLLG